MAHFPGGQDLEDELIPEPVYFRLGDTNFRKMEEIENQILGEEEEEDLSDSEMEVTDLTAPPSQAWFHGCISRQETVTRLKSAGMPHCYLVRESQTRPGTYVLSYMAQNGYVHHFRIHTICGDYYIGNRQFLSLQDLIGYYSRNYVVEDGLLQYPVPPPQPVPVYILVRALGPYNKKQPEEIDVRQGEVFVLKNRMDDNWAWGTSQLSGSSGIIPLVIMEEVHKENHWYYGKVWFRPDISKDKSIELLKTRKVVGSFIVRPSMSGYSLAVLTLSGVQRFLIEEMTTFHYFLSLGGRNYSSIDDIIERYKMEDISAGVRLTEPLDVGPLPTTSASVKNFEPPQSVPPPIPNMPRPSDGGDGRKPTNLMKAHFLTKKGRKLVGKWKSMCLVLDPQEGELQFYEKPSNHRAKALLDLVHCRVFPVHRSLTGMSDSFCILSRYGREEQLFYLACGNRETAKTWFDTLVECTHRLREGGGACPSQVSPAHQIHSLLLSVREIKLHKPGQYYFIVAMENVRVGRSPLFDRAESVFEDVYKFDNLPNDAKSVSIEVFQKTLLVDNSWGTAMLKLAELPNGQEDDQWHPVLVSRSKTAQANARITVTYQHEPILDIARYRELHEVLFSPDKLKYLDIMANIFRHHHADLARVLVHLYANTGDRGIVPLIIEASTKVVTKEENVATLFRSSSLATMLMDQYMKQTASDYLRWVLQDSVTCILESPESCEIDPSQTHAADLNLERLKLHLTDVVEKIFHSPDRCPRPLRHIFYNLRQMVSQRWSDNTTVNVTAVSGFLFLRLFTPALLKPQLFSLSEGRSSPTAERTLSLMSRILQKLGNQTMFKARDTYLLNMNDFLKDRKQQMCNFIDAISSEPTCPSEEPSEGDPTRDFAEICILCRIYRKDLEKFCHVEPNLSGLLSALDSVERAAKKS